MTETAVVLGLAAGALLSLVGLTWRTVASHLVTVVHEFGHVVMAVVVGGRPSAVRLHRDSSGLTSWGGRRPLGRVRRTAVVSAGIPAPALAGLMCVVAVVDDRSRLALAGLAAIVAVVAVLVRNPWGFVVVAGLVAGLVVSWQASDLIAAVVLAVVGGLLAVGAVRAGWAELRTRRSRPGGDAAQLAGLTHVPAGICAGGLLVVCVAAAAAAMLRVAASM